MVKSVVEQLTKYGKVEHGILGVNAQNITPALVDALNLKNTDGVLVTKVVPGSPAEKAGLQVEDIIESINQITIHMSEQLHNICRISTPWNDRSFNYSA